MCTKTEAVEAGGGQVSWEHTFFLSMPGTVRWKILELFLHLIVNDLRRGWFSCGICGIKQLLANISL